MYINCKTWFSLHYGTINTEDLVALAAERGVRAMALTNINSTSDTWDFVAHCKQAGIKPVAGAEIRNDSQLCYILLAKNNTGLFCINRFISGRLQEEKNFEDRPLFDENVFVIYPLGRLQPQELLPNEFIGVQSNEVNKLYGTDMQAHKNKFIIRHPVTFQNTKYYNVHRLLRAIHKNIVITKQQPCDIAGAHEEFVPPSALLQSFSAYPAIVTNTLQLIDACSIDLDFNRDKTKKIYSASMQDDKVLLEKLANDGLYQRYGRKNSKAKERVEKELKIIHDKQFNAYFLITWDILRYAKNREFFFVGRGSGANSIVAYCLGITDVDPLELDLYFERFLNPERDVPPDFDIDFSWKDRNEMTDYIFKRYGSEHVCLLGSYTTFQYRAIVRELGKVFGLPKSEIDALAQDGNRFEDDAIQKRILYYGRLMEKFPNHLSIHAGGMLISDAPVHHYTVTELPPKGFQTSQLDMYMAEKVGLYKLDILSQRGLGHIKDSIDIIRQNRQVSIDIHEVEKFKRDTNLAAKIRAADTIGCFYIESPAMRQLLKKLECDDYLTLVAASSIIRPGVAQSGMMRQYIYRYHHPNSFEYLHPKMEELLKETYGVMVYQEDVIKVAHHFAGLDMGEGDRLRRAMSGKYRGNKDFEQIKQHFFANCAERGYADTLSQEVWRQIESFGSFSFSKAHSASFAVESYQSLFLKTYYPAEFLVAVINNFGGFYQTEVYFHELKRTGVQVVPPCVNEGEYLTIIHGTTVHVGLIHVQGLEEKVVTDLLEEKNVHGPYLHLQDLIERTAIALEQLNILIRIGACRFTGKNKKELLWEANFLQKKMKPSPAHASLFHEPPLQFNLPPLHHHPLDDAMDEMELLGFPLCNVWELADADTSPFVTAAELPLHLGKTVEVIGYYVTTKTTRTIKNETMHFGTFLDKAGDWIDTVHFPGSFQYSPFQGRGFYIMKGKVIEEFHVHTIEVESCMMVGIKSTR